uniref:Uncharacterized protein n=1 Tax=Tanacetum cinerariifolium TaxID=118510 RepID=A0A699KWI2_TANCI|nr:hypothetical protein [Tanacetum cinerariifolium]
MGRSREGLGTVQVRWGCTGVAGEEVAVLAGKGVKEYCAIRVTYDRPMKKRGFASWDGSTCTWRGRAEAMGTIPVCVCVYRKGWGEGLVVWAGKVVNTTVWVVKVLGVGNLGPWGLIELANCLGYKSFSPSGDFEIFTLLVSRLCLLSFEGLGFDLLARLVPRLDFGINELHCELYC